MKQGRSYGYKFHFNAGTIYAAWFVRASLVGLCTGYVGFDSHDHRLGNNFSTPAPGAPNVGLASYRSSLLPLLVVAHYRDGYEGVGGHSPQAPRQV
nr:hypothetical protein [Nitrosomonas communis]